MIFKKFRLNMAERILSTNKICLLFIFRTDSLTT